ncbi:hypothetical protein F5884DRAFT_770939 [Xylogone sp. PMI_703]|nr:hypothetical protein F5884DRAFT_770939 [Xylogone sp. PMI_703]
MAQRPSASQRGSTATNRSRNASPILRGVGRGGIQKRRGGSVRVDRDGDLVMDAAAASNRNKTTLTRHDGRPSPARGGSMTGQGRGGLGSQRSQQAILRGLNTRQANVLETHISRPTSTTIRVDGLRSSKAASNADGGLESLLAFLERKASGLDAKSNRTVKIKKSHMEGDSVIITVSPQDAATILKLDNFSFAGTPLSIRSYETPASTHSNKAGEREPEISRSAKEIQDQIQGILSTRYDPNLKLLNLSALGKDPGLLKMGIFDERNTISKLFPVLMVVCDRLFSSREEKRNAIISVTLSDNELEDLTKVTTLAQTFPDLKNLDLSRNNLKDLRSIELWRWKFRYLENLVMTGNPIESLYPDYKTDILRWYPNLQILNGVQVRSAEEIAAALEAVKSPIPISGPDFRDAGQIGENFIRQFLSLYDSDRMSLIATFYDSRSLFSLSINMTAPRDPQNSAPIPPWAPYTKHSRNLVKITHLPARMTRRYCGIEQIQALWSSLPTTRHPDLSTQADKYVIDCHPLPGLADPTGQSIRGVDGLILSIHGEFEELPSPSAEKALRSFSRTFVLGPGLPQGPPIRVVSDLLVLKAWTPLPLPSITANNLGPLAPAAEQQNQEAIIIQLAEKTGMTPAYAMLCLTETGWDIEKAFAAFIANKDKLPQEAFV